MLLEANREVAKKRIAVGFRRIRGLRSLTFGGLTRLANDISLSAARFNRAESSAFPLVNYFFLPPFTAFPAGFALGEAAGLAAVFLVVLAAVFLAAAIIYGSLTVAPIPFNDATFGLAPAAGCAIRRFFSSPSEERLPRRSLFPRNERRRAATRNGIQLGQRFRSDVPPSRFLRLRKGGIVGGSKIADVA
jgi:hypothetical protein